MKPSTSPLHQELRATFVRARRAARRRPHGDTVQGARWNLRFWAFCLRTDRAVPRCSVTRNLAVEWAGRLAAARERAA